MRQQLQILLFMSHGLQATAVAAVLPLCCTNTACSVLLQKGYMDSSLSVSSVMLLNSDVGPPQPQLHALMSDPYFHCSSCHAQESVPMLRHAAMLHAWPRPLHTAWALAIPRSWPLPLPWTCSCCWR